ncbi:hypothetical protein [Modestobacter sp. Leaf380]|uniref:hypothetical protein n=1 Tax=Modestobacter sp. Leaf380 TaxID=1736356 RepID=UPI0012F799E6|nr:hypothetical protein [Modestobacter sp. Leaf380]
MIERFSVSPVLVDYWGTLTDRNTNRPDRRAYAISYGLPAVLTAVAVWRGWKLPELSVLLGGTSLLVGALIGLFFHLSSVRLQVENDPRLRSLRRVPTLVDNTAITVLYAAGVAIFVSVVIVVAAALPRTAPSWSTLTTTVASIYLCTHLVVTMLTVLRLAWGVYVEVYNVPTPSTTGRR